RDFVRRELRVTPLGREVLAGKKDWQDINTESRWLGGVEIEPGAKGGGWRWDPEERVLVRKKSPAARKRVPVKKRSPARKRSPQKKKK
ncbi:MAG TPA: hypothetical protein VN927_01160, partial [Gemmatimonadaceae bacterium]|nr:hypothetical protein [Gemmatimonadaceae bacterium]